MRVPDRLAYLGRALDMTLEHNGERTTIGWSRSHWLCTDEGRRDLWIVPAPRTRGRQLERGEAKALEDVVRLWSQFEPTRLTAAEFRLGHEKQRGVAVSIAYRSDKWTGRLEDYEHAFNRPASVVQAGDVYRLSGPRLRVTAAGVTG